MELIEINPKGREAWYVFLTPLNSQKAKIMANNEPLKRPKRWPNHEPLKIVVLCMDRFDYENFSSFSELFI